jgi:hypothetical protein
MMTLDLAHAFSEFGDMIPPPACAQISLIRIFLIAIVDLIQKYKST